MSVSVYGFVRKVIYIDMLGFYIIHSLTRVIPKENVGKGFAVSGTFYSSMTLCVMEMLDYKYRSSIV